MVHNATTWVNGDLITAALLNNGENQYSDYASDWGYKKYSTASTDTCLLSATTGYTAYSTSAPVFFDFTIPPHIQKSRVEVTFVARSSHSGYQTLYIGPHADTTNAWYTEVTKSNKLKTTVSLSTISYSTVSAVIDIFGGERLCLWAGSTLMLLESMQIYANATTPDPISTLIPVMTTWAT